MLAGPLDPHTYALKGLLSFFYPLNPDTPVSLSSNIPLMVYLQRIAFTAITKTLGSCYLTAYYANEAINEG